MINTIISHYKILEKLGEGGMGVVYKAHDTKLDRPVAIKFLSAGHTVTDQDKTRFIHEARAASALEHPNICTIHEIDETPDGRMFLVMPAYEGIPLNKKIGEKPLAVCEALDIAIQIADGLQAAHEKGIVHRDMKSSNIFVTSKGQVKIMDFGLARSAGMTLITKTGTTVGTVPYMSPEQARGEKVDQRTDIWSLGVILYEMITGQLPFRSEYSEAIVYSILNEEPEPVTGLRTGVPVDLERIIQKCMSKMKDERYQTVQDLVADLHRVQRITTSEIRAPLQDRFHMPVHRVRRLRPWMAGLALGLVIVVLIILRVFISTEQLSVSERKMLVVLPFENLGPPDDEYFAAGMTDEITSRLASVSGLGVISRTSAIQYAGTQKTARQIGEELGVDYILEGTVRWARGPESTNRVRITPQIIRVVDDTHIWAEQYERVIDDIFEIQSDIAQMVVKQLDVTILEHERNAVETRPTKSLEAYQAYLRGRYHSSRPHFNVQDWIQAVQSYQQAVQLDPEFALAFAELSKAHGKLYYLRYDNSDERRSQSEQVVNRAVELAPDAPETHIALGYYQFWVRRDVEEALKEFAKATKGLPENAEILIAIAELTRMQGKMEEAVRYYNRAFELNPREADAVLELGLTYWWLRKYPEALKACNQAIALAPDQAWPYLCKVFNYWSWNGVSQESRAALEGVPILHEWAVWTWYWQEFCEGRYREAIERLSLGSDDWIRIKMWAMPKSLLAAYAYEFLNEPEQARTAYENAKDLLEAEIKRRPGDARYRSSLGIAYAALGQKEEAIREGLHAVELLPNSKDAVYSLGHLQDLAITYTFTNEYDAALDQLEYQLSIPGYISVAWIKMDPRWSRLCDHPRFKALIEKYSDR
jgi:eukaryotic-like serine/threonine-protein kinase